MPWCSRQLALRWSDVDQHATPALWKLASQGSIGALTSRAASAVTCPDSGWVTLGAGNRARGLSRGECAQTAEEFPTDEPTPTGDHYQLTEQSEIVDRNASLNHGAKPGALASSVRCVTAIGRHAAVAAAHPDGRVDSYYPSLPDSLNETLAQCPVTIVDIGDVTAENRAADLAALDARVAKVVAALPSSSLLITAGIADFSAPPHLHVGMMNGPGFGRDWLTSSSTGRQPFVQLIDITPTILHAFNVGTPSSVAGQPMHSSIGRDESLAASVRRLDDSDRAAAAQRPLVQVFFAVLVWSSLALMIAAAIFFRLRHRSYVEAEPQSGGKHDPGHFLVARAGTFARILQVAAVFLGSIPVASLLVNLVPWWRAGGLAGAVNGAGIAAIATAVTAVAYAGPWRRNALGPPGAVAAITALVLAGEVLAGSPLQLDAVSGYSPLVAGRFIGFGNIGSAIFAGGLLLATAYVAQTISGRGRRLAVLVTIGVISIVLVGAPSWGDDFGGVIAFTPALLVLTLRSVGVRLSLPRVLACVAMGVVAVSAFVGIDYLRPAEERSHVGRFAGQVMDGTAGMIIHRKAEANFGLLVSSQLTFLVIGAAVFVPLILLRRSAGLRRTFGLYPCVRAGALAIVVYSVIGLAVNDSGIAVPAFTLTVALPLMVATTLRVLGGVSVGVKSGRSTPSAATRRRRC